MAGIDVNWAIDSSVAFVDALGTLTRSSDPPLVSQPTAVADEYILGLNQLLGMIGDTPSFGFTGNIPGNIASPPTLSNIDTSGLSGITVPDFTDVLPVLNFPATVPNPATPVAPGSPPSFISPTMPVKGTYVLPTVPVLAPITVPNAPTLQYPTFSASLPSENLLVPTNNFNFIEEQYSSVILPILKSKLFNDLNDGGYGIEIADEVALFARAKDRASKEALSKIRDVRNSGASNGFSLPQGVLFEAERDVLDEMSETMADINREITLEKSRLYNETRKFTIEKGISLEDMLQRYHNSRMERALNVQKSLLDAGISVFNSQLAKYNANLDAYKTEASVYDSKMRAVLAQVEVYRSELEGAKIRGEINSLEVNIYQATIEAVTATMGIYKTEMEAAAIQAQVEKLKLDGYMSTVQAFAEKVKANIAEFDMYEAQIKGEVAKIEGFKAQVGAYSALVSSKQAQIGAESSKIEAEIKASSLLIDKYRVDVEGFKAEVSGAAAFIQAEVSRANSGNDVYNSRVKATLGAFEATAEVQKAQMTMFSEYEKLKIQAAEANLRGMLIDADTRVKASAAGAGVYKGLVMGALSAVTQLDAAIISTVA